MVSPYEEIRNDGRLERWNNGLTQYSNIPVFHYSIGLPRRKPHHLWWGRKKVHSLLRGGVQSPALSNGVYTVSKPNMGFSSWV